MPPFATSLQNEQPVFKKPFVGLPRNGCLALSFRGPLTHLATIVRNTMRPKDALAAAIAGVVAAATPISIASD